MFKFEEHAGSLPSIVPCFKLGFGQRWCYNDMGDFLQIDTFFGVEVHEKNTVVIYTESPLAKAKVAVELQGNSYAR